MSVYKGMNIKVIKSKNIFWHNVGEIYNISSEGESCVYVLNKGAISDENYKTLLDDVFLQKFKDEKIAVNCETKEEAMEFYNWMIGYGLKTFEDHELKLQVYDDKTTYCYGNNKHIQYADIEYDKEEEYTIIKYKDLIKDKKENVMKNKFKVGDRVIIKDTGKNYSIYDEMAQKLKAIKYKKGKSPRVNLNCRVMNVGEHTTDEGITIYLVDDGKYEYLIEEDGLIKKKKESGYKVIKSFTLKDILDKSPCRGEFDDLVHDVYENEGTFNSVLFEDANWGEYEVLRDNKDWLIEKGFIEKIGEEIILELGMKLKNDEYEAIVIQTGYYEEKEQLSLLLTENNDNSSFRVLDFKEAPYTFRFCLTLQGLNNITINCNDFEIVDKD